MAARRQGKRGRQAVRGAERAPLPAWLWLVGGILIGLGASGALILRDWLSESQSLPRPNPQAQAPAPASGEAGIADDADTAKPTRPRYDFYTVLPEMEVVIPDAELKTAAAQPQDASTTPTTEQRFLLQAGSFRSAGDADALKAKLALLGVVARVQSVTINGTTWHRVRVGPYSNARALDEAKQNLAGNGIEAIALRESPE